MNKYLNFKYLIFTTFLIYFLCGTIIFDDYSVTPDEELHRVNGLISLKYIIGLFSNNAEELSSLTNIPDLYNDWRRTYGILFDLPISVIQLFFKINNQEVFLIKHYVNFIIFFIACIYFYFLLKQNIKNEKLALIGILILITTPRIFSHSFYNSKDILFLSLVIISVYYCIKLLKNVSPKNIIIVSLFCALASNIRILGLFLPILTFIFYYFNDVKNKQMNTFKFFLVLFSSYFIFLYLIWPFLWLNPLSNFLLILKESSAYPNHWNFDILYLGNYINPEHIPWHYFFVWFSYTTPTIYLLLIIVGLFVFLKNYLNFFLKIDFKKKILLWSNQDQMINLFIFSVFFIPIFFIVCLNSTLYNGWRHLFFLYPFLVYLSLYGILIIKKKKNRKIYKSIIFFIIIQTSNNLYFIYKSHPIQNVYFNIFSKSYVNDYMPVDYWGLGNKKSIDYILKNNDRFTISNSSYTPLHYLKFSKRDGSSYTDLISFKGTDIKTKLKSDFVFTNYYFNENPLNVGKFSIPQEYKSYYKLIIDGIVVNEVFIR